ncbi:MAG: relaxase/mobilization nuclease domain-containing protein [Clostridia bacterium]|nr:relaxase/mobilization nuclease domain-containing protein [Clostridia bacterium]
MATTHIIPIHHTRGRTIERCLRERLDYAMNPEKTDQGELISAYACNPETVDGEWLLSKRQYRDITGRTRKREVLAYQVRQSFLPGEVTPEEANRIGYEFASRFLKENHAFIVATHIDKHHIHNHIIWNATSLDCQRKFRNFFLSYKAVARLSDLVCTEHHLSVVLDPKHTGTDYGAWLGSHRQISHREALMMAVDAALAQKPKDFETFLKLLRDAGVEVKTGKQISLRMIGRTRFARLDTIGEQYTEESLRAIIKGQKAHKPHTRRAPSVQLDRIQLMIDIAEKTKEDKGEGYVRWAKKYNLKQLARSVVYLTDLGISSEKQMQTRLADATTRHDSLRDSIRIMDDRMNEISALQRHIFNYKKYRKVYADYKASGYSKRFAADHQQELALFKAARQAFDAAGITKLPKIEDLRAEFAELKEQKQTKLAEYREARDELNNLRKAKGNVDSVISGKEIERQSDEHSAAK